MMKRDGFEEGMCMCGGVYVRFSVMASSDAMLCRAVAIDRSRR